LQIPWKEFTARRGDRVLKWIDMPPVWLAAALALAWMQATQLSYGLGFGPIWADLLGGVLVGAGILLMLLAVWEMYRHRTTVIPHREADRMVTTGIFSRTRNPIYLGDSLILVGMILYWDAVLALPLVPLFVWVIERRFIIPEEDRLRRKFRADFARYAQQVRRWL
jgi:protein-S-isoprenylcysteine O-methyltransferase Ste14